MNTSIKNLTKIGKTMLILGIALVSAAVLASTVLAESATKWYEQERLGHNCATVVVPEAAEAHTLYDPMTGVVDVSWSVGEQENHVDLPFAAIAGCNARNLALLNIVRQDYRDQVHDTCNEFRGMIAGKIPVPKKNGQHGNLSAAKKYIEKHCH